MSNKQQVISPIDGSVYLERNYAQPKQVDLALGLASRAQKNGAIAPLLSVKLCAVML